MNALKTTLMLLVLTAIAGLTGCRAPEDQYHDEQEYSNMPWNTPQDWEGSRSVPGLGSGGQGY